MGLLTSVRRLFGKTNHIQLDSKSKFVKGNGVQMKNCVIVLNNSELHLADSVVLINARITILSGQVSIGEGSIIEGHHDSIIFVDNGKMIVGKKSRLRNSTIVRFDGVCTVGDYTAINEGTEIRCDERVDIGSFNMISYNCQINDTNTHNILPIEERRALTMKQFPVIGSESKRPPSKPTIIGDDCWIGKGVTILKGVTIGNGAVIGTQAVVTKNVPAMSVAAGNPATIIKKLSTE